MKNKRKYIYLFTIIVLMVAVIESFSYYGFLKNHTGIPSISLYLIWLPTVIIFNRLFRVEHVKDSIKKYAIVLLSIFMILYLIESFTYPNFIYSNLRINLISAPYLISLIITLYVITVDISADFTKIISAALINIGLGIYLINNVPETFSQVYKGISQIVQNPYATYDEQMYKSYGDFYYAMKWVKKITPEDSIIAIPPQEKPWLTEGNGALVRYFLYPRQLTHVENVNYDVVPTHYLIAKGSWKSDDENTYGWPKEKINSTKIWKFNGMQEPDIFTNSYDPEKNKWDWGLIEVKK